MFGLDEKIIKEVCGILRNYSSIKEAKIFGSRALDTFRINSDVDIVLYGDLEADLNIQVRANLEALPTPYQFDIVSYPHLQNAALKDHIDRVGKVFYSKN